MVQVTYCPNCGNEFHRVGNSKTCGKSQCRKALRHKVIDRSESMWYVGTGLWTDYTHYVSYETGLTACGKRVRLKEGETLKKHPECKTCRKRLE